MKTKKLLVVLMICYWTLSACQSAPTISPTAQPTDIPTNTPTAHPTDTPTITPKPTITPEPTQTPNIAATQQYESFSLWVQKFHEEGLIASTEGNFVSIEDFSDSLAEENSFKYTSIDYKSTNYIIQADIKIESAVEGIKYGGCGFAFWEETDPDSVYAIFFFQDGRAYFLTPGWAAPDKSNYIDSALATSPEGMKLTLLVYNNKLNFYVNDRLGISIDRIFSYYSEESILLGPAVASGTGEKFGTRCDFTNMILWIMD